MAKCGEPDKNHCDNIGPHQHAWVHIHVAPYNAHQQPTTHVLYSTSHHDYTTAGTFNKHTFFHDYNNYMHLLRLTITHGECRLRQPGMGS